MRIVVWGVACQSMDQLSSNRELTAWESNQSDDIKFCDGPFRSYL